MKVIEQRKKQKKAENRILAMKATPINTIYKDQLFNSKYFLAV